MSAVNEFATSTNTNLKIDTIYPEESVQLFLDFLKNATSIYTIKIYYVYLLFINSNLEHKTPFYCTPNSTKVQWNAQLIESIINYTNINRSNIYKGLNWLMDNNYISLSPKNISPEPEIKNTPTETKIMAEPQNKNENTSNINLDDYVDFVF